HDAIRCPMAMALADQFVRARFERCRDLFAEPNPRPRDPIAANKLAIEPGCAIARHLPVQVVAGEYSHIRLPPTLGVISQRALLEVLRDEPAVGAETLYDPRPPERLQAAHMA